MNILIILFILAIFYMYITSPCSRSHRTKSGRMYKSRDQKTAELLDTLRDISIDLTTSIRPDDSYLLAKNLQNTSFIELIDQNPKIMAWNYDKGREIGVKIYDRTGRPLSADEIINSLLHELAHSTTVSWGHGPEWQENNEHLQRLRKKYVKILIIKTFINK